MLSGCLCCDIHSVNMLSESFRTLSPLNTAYDNLTQYGDHSRQVEIVPSAHVSPLMQRSFGDRGDAYHIFNDAPHDFRTSSSGVSSAKFVDHISDVGISTFSAETGSSSLDVELTGKPVQLQITESIISPVAKSHSKYESGDAVDQTLSNETTVSMLPTAASTTDKRLNWETLFMPYRRNDAAAQTVQPIPVTVAKESGYRAPVNLATLHEGFSETCIMRQYSEGDVHGPDCADNASMDNTSLWVMSCEISMTVIVYYGIDF